MDHTHFAEGSAMRVGPWQVDGLLDRCFLLDGGSMCGVVPRAVWSNTFEPDAEGRIVLAARCLLARHEGGAATVLIDGGIGNRWAGKARQLFGVEQGPGLINALADISVQREQITDVVMTHLHFDHAGGLVEKSEHGDFKPTFPHARVHIQKEHLAWAMNPSPRDRASFRAADFHPLDQSGLLVCHEGEGEILPDLSVRVSYGHSAAMQLPLLTDGNKTIAFVGDLVPTSAHIKLTWGMAYDNQPLVIIEEKKKLLAQACEQGWILTAPHDPRLSAFALRPGKAGNYVAVPVDL